MNSRRRADLVYQLGVLQQAGTVDTHTRIPGQKQTKTVTQICDNRERCGWRMACIDALRLAFQEVADTLKQSCRLTALQGALYAHLGDRVCCGKCGDTAGTQPVVTCSGRIGRTVENSQNPAGKKNCHVVPGVAAFLYFDCEKLAIFILLISLQRGADGDTSVTAAIIFTGV